MTIQKAMDSIEEILCSTVRSDNSIAYELDTNDCDWIEMAKSALEKQIPKKPIEKEVIGVSMSGYKYKGQCPKCSLTVSQFLGNYCHHCGQALDWSDNNA